MKPPFDGWISLTTKQPIYIPSNKHGSPAHMVWVEVPSWKDPQTGTIYLDGFACEQLELEKRKRMETANIQISNASSVTS